MPTRPGDVGSPSILRSSPTSEMVIERTRSSPACTGCRGDRSPFPLDEGKRRRASSDGSTLTVGRNSSRRQHPATGVGDLDLAADRPRTRLTKVSDVEIGRCRVLHGGIEALPERDCAGDVEQGR